MWVHTLFYITHWGWVMHICIGNLTIIGPDIGLSPGRRQAIIWTNAWILLIGPWGTNISEILICIQTFSFKEMHLKMASAKWRPFCLGLNVITPLHKRWSYYHSLGLSHWHDFVASNRAWSRNPISSEWVIKFNGLSQTVDIEAHVIHTSSVIISYTMESLCPLT